MEHLQLTAMETAVLEMIHKFYGEYGFPPPSAVRVLKRTNTGGGRYTHIESDAYFDVGGRVPLNLGGRIIEMKGLPLGMMGAVMVEDHRLDYIEFAVYGGDHWSGEEVDWKIVGPLPDVLP